ncbi:MAG: hypothetical protein ABIK89_16815 [Planctomycetota bacterium]
MAKMYHIETMTPRGSQAELEAFFRDEALPYWRSRGFEVKVYVTQHSLGRGPVWLFTGMDSFGDLDRWPAMAAGEPEGERLMTKLLDLVTDLQASVVRDIE